MYHFSLLGKNWAREIANEMNDDLSIEVRMYYTGQVFFSFEFIYEGIYRFKLT